MPYYEELYHDLFNGITNTIDEMSKTIEHMKNLQAQAENKYLTLCEEEKEAEKRFLMEVLSKYEGKTLSEFFKEAD